MSGVRAIVVDDEPPARARLVRMLEAIDAVEVVAEAENGPDALSVIQQTEADVVFLDIRMPGISGLEVASRLTETSTSPAVIFTTAYDEHALAAFDARAVDYLLKPIRAARLEEAVARIRGRRLATPSSDADRGAIEDQGENHGQNQGEHPDEAEPESLRPETLTGQYGSALRTVAVSDIRFLRADQKYVEARFEDGVLLLDASLVTLEQSLGERFIRIHRNALAAVEHIIGLERSADGGHVVELSGVTEKLEVSRRMVGRVRATVFG